MAQIANRISNQFLMLIFFLCLSGNVITQDTTISAQKDDTSFVDSANNKESVFIEERKISDSVINRLKNDDAFWYANAVRQNSKTKTGKKNVFEKVYQQEWARNLLWALFVGCFIALIIWFVSNSRVALFSTKAKLINPIEDDTITDDIHLINFDAEIAAAIEKGAYRLAVRLLYLQLLKLMSDVSIISYSIEKTNSDYLHEMKSHSCYSDFFKLTRDFEYVWYGQFYISKVVFEKMLQDFTAIKNKLRH